MVFAVNKNLAAIKLKVALLHLQSCQYIRGLIFRSIFSMHARGMLNQSEIQCRNSFEMVEAGILHGLIQKLDFIRIFLQENVRNSPDFVRNSVFSKICPKLAGFAARSRLDPLPQHSFQWEPETIEKQASKASQTAKQQVAVHCLQPEAVWIPSPSIHFNGSRRQQKSRRSEASQTAKQQVAVHCLQPEAVCIPSPSIHLMGAGDNRKVGEAKRDKL